MSKEITALLIDDAGLLAPMTLGLADDGLWYGRAGIGYKPNPAITTTLRGWLGYDSLDAVAMVAEDAADRPVAWADPRGLQQ